MFSKKYHFSIEHVLYTVVNYTSRIVYYAFSQEKTCPFWSGSAHIIFLTYPSQKYDIRVFESGAKMVLPVRIL